MVIQSRPTVFNGTLPACTRVATHADLTADQALEILRRGNQDFVNDRQPQVAMNRARRLEIAKRQTPFAVLFGCSESRVAPELLFGQGQGELFIVRVAGNTVDRIALGSIEYRVAEPSWAARWW